MREYLPLRSPHRSLVALTLALAAVRLSAVAVADTVAWYRFEEGPLGTIATGVGTVLDSSGNGLHGSATGGDGPVYVGALAPFAALALDFDGVNDEVLVPDDPKLKLTQSLTLEAFINVRGLGTQYLSNNIIHRGDDRPGQDAYILQVKPNTGELRFWVEGGGTGGAADLRTPFTWLGRTIHVAGVLDDTTGFMGLYVNRRLKNSLTTTIRARGDLDPAHNPGLGIGNHAVPGGGFPLDGTIDEVRISDAALSPQELLCSVPPVLAWAGSPRYRGDGVDPNRGFRGDRFSFRVKYRDWNGDPAIYVRVEIRRNGEPYGTFPLRPAFGSPRRGQVFRLNRRLPVGEYSYRFAAADADGPATGKPTEWTPGPQVDAPLQPRPDALVKIDDRWLGNNLYNTTGTGQQHAQDVHPRGMVRYRARIQNDRADPDTLRVRGPGSRGPWQFAYFAVPGTNITADVTGAGWVVPAMPSGATHDIIVRVSATTGAKVGTKKAALLRVGRALWTPEKFVLRADTVRLLTTVVADGATPVCQVTSLSAAPTRAGAQVVFSLSGPATVSARVMNIAGRPVATICRARHHEAGTNTLLWNARGDSGLPVPNGTYLVEVNARAEDGSQARALGQVRIQR